MIQSIEFVEILKFPALYLRLLILLIHSCNPNNVDDFVTVYRKTSVVYEIEFLNAKGKNYSSKIQAVTRIFADFLIRAKRPMHGIAMIAKAIKVLRASNEQVSSLHT